MPVSHSAALTVITLMRQGEPEEEQSCGTAISQKPATMRAVIISVLILSNLSNFGPHSNSPSLLTIDVHTSI